MQIDPKKATPLAARGSRPSSHQDAPAESDWKTKKIFVGGLPYDATDQHLRDFFGKYGVVEEVLLMYDRESGRPRGLLLVIFFFSKTLQE